MLYPADTGGRIRSLRIFERLSRWHELTLLCFRTRDDTLDRLEQMRRFCTLETVDWSETAKSGARFHLELARSVFSPLPYTVAKYRRDTMNRRLSALLAAERFDLLVCDFLQPSVNCLGLRFQPKILFQHNVETGIRHRLTAVASNPLAKAFLLQDTAKLQRFERRAAASFDHCIMVSEEDCRMMARLHGVERTSAIPMGIDTDYFRPMSVAGRDTTLVFAGSMDMLANEDAVQFFVRDILPRIRREIPVKLVIAGRNPTPAVLDLASDPHVTVTGTVDDIRPFLAGAHLMVVPLRVGGGTRLKIFEAMAMGLPVISTPIGAEGLPVTDGVDIVLAATAADFAAGVIRLVRDPAERARVAVSGRSLVSRGYRWDRAAAHFSDICIDVVTRHRAARTS
jgi:glycosyltransferase involved in cell wall biosynthesis